MRRLAGLDRRLDRSEHRWRKITPLPPAMLQQMPADAFDAHIYQLPDAPPPPKLPPPPPLSLELLELLDQSLLPPPPDQPPLPPDLPLRPPDDGIVMASLNITRTDDTRPASSARMSEPKKNQAISATRPPATPDPSRRPSIIRRAPPNSSTGISRNGLNRSPGSNERVDGCQCGGSGAGNFSPSMTRIILSTPAEMPPAKSLFLKRGVMISSIIRLEVTSFSAPSRP